MSSDFGTRQVEPLIGMLWETTEIPELAQLFRPLQARLSPLYNPLIEHVWLQIWHSRQ